jgi:hypothetical protein
MRGWAPVWLRAIVTFAAPVIVLLLDRVPLPLIDRAALRDLDANARFSPFSLGVSPIISAFLLVELAAFLVPPWRRLRFDPRGRARLGEATAVLAVLVAAVQGWVMVRWMESFGWGGYGYGQGVLLIPDPGLQTQLVLTATFMGGTFLLAVLAWLVDRWSLANGWCIVMAAGIVDPIASLVRSIAEAPVSAFAIDLALVVTAAILVLTVWLLRRRVGPIRLPAAGIAPFQIGDVIVGILGVVSAAGLAAAQAPIPFIALPDLAPLRLVILAALAVACTVVYARAASPDGRSLGVAAAVSTGYVLAIAAAQGFGVRTLGALPILPLVVLTALVMDVVVEWKARLARIDLVPVWPLHKAHQVDAALAALAAAGIPAHARGRHYRMLFQFFAPFVPVMIHAPADLADEARRILANMR